MPSIDKTNAMRKLDLLGIAYESAAYPTGKTPPGAEQAAEMIGASAASVFKTLVAQSSGGEHYVFVVPAASSLSLKKAAAAVGAKSVALVPECELISTTGYRKGGCSPIGMKKQFATIIDESALALEQVYVSAGRIGLMLVLAPKDLAAAAGARFADIRQ